MVRSYDPRSTTGGTACLTWMCVQAILGRCPMCKALRAVEGLLLGYKGIQGAFKEYWNIRGGIGIGTGYSLAA